MVDPVYRAGTGEPLVLLHGFTDTAHAWTRVRPALEAKHEVYVWNLPGHYGGEPWDRSVPFSMASTLDILERQLDALGLRQAHLVGNSLGGFLALKLAERGRALSAVGICPAGGWDLGGKEQKRAARFFRRNQILLRLGGRFLPAIARRPRLRALALRDLIADPRSVTESEALAMFEGSRRCEVVDDVLHLAYERDPWGDFAPISCPVTIMYGTRDKLLRWPAYFTRMRRQFAGATWVPLDGLGHLPMWDGADVVTTTILRQTASSAPSH